MFIQDYAGTVIAAVLIVGGFLLGVREVAKGLSRSRGNERRTRRVGRYTAAVLLASVGVLLLMDARDGTHNMLLLLKWWPVITGAVGCGIPAHLLFLGPQRSD